MPTMTSPTKQEKYMPRATHHQQYQRHQTLRELGITRPMALIRLDARSQLALGAFYDTDRDHTVESLRAHQRDITRSYPSLPQRAGKAYSALMQLLPKLDALEARPPRKNAPREIFVFSEVNSNVDPKEFAKILYNYAMRQAEEARRKREDEDKNEAA